MTLEPKMNMLKTEKRNESTGQEPTVDSGGPVEIKELRRKLNKFVEGMILMQRKNLALGERKIRMQAISPRERVIDRDKSGFGEYSVSPETMRRNWSKLEPGEVISLEAPKDLRGKFVGKPRWDFIQYVIKEYGEEYDFPGFEYQTYLLDNPDKTPPIIKNRDHHYFAGSSVRDGNGHLQTPFLRWNGREFENGSDLLDGNYLQDEHIVAVKKRKKEFQPPTLQFKDSEQENSEGDGNI